jgi:hypothetical protein
VKEEVLTLVIGVGIARTSEARRRERMANDFILELLAAVLFLLKNPACLWI